MVIMSWIAMLCSFCGNILINFQIVWGFPVWILSNLLWVLFELHNHGWKIKKINAARILMYAGYSLLNVHGLISWLIK